MIVPYKGRLPLIDASVFVADTARVIGDVSIGADSSVWFGSVIRGDVNYIRIGKRTNIQDLTVIHVNHGTHPTILEDGITVGHRAILHGCRVKRGCLVGMGAILLDEVVVEEESFVAAGALVSPGTRIPARSMARGVPARVVRELEPEELEQLKQTAQYYYELKNDYLEEGA